MCHRWKGKEDYRGEVDLPHQAAECAPHPPEHLLQVPAGRRGRGRGGSHSGGAGGGCSGPWRPPRREPQWAEALWPGGHQPGQDPRPGLAGEELHCPSPRLCLARQGGSAACGGPAAGIRGAGRAEEAAATVSPQQPGASPDQEERHEPVGGLPGQASAHDPQVSAPHAQTDQPQCVPPGGRAADPVQRGRGAQHPLQQEERQGHLPQKRGVFSWRARG
mmetsp:Transcript_11637/g.17203  ORF Transcript_11637/g.17203 Transcript_11637/m.17203 type:complete len:219 (+) Transcript_11637:85-741(+)